MPNPHLHHFLVQKSYTCGMGRASTKPSPRNPARSPPILVCWLVLWLTLLTATNWEEAERTLFSLVRAQHLHLFRCGRPRARTPGLLSIFSVLFRSCQVFLIHQQWKFWRPQRLTPTRWTRLLCRHLVEVTSFVLFGKVLARRDLSRLAQPLTRANRWFLSSRMGASVRVFGMPVTGLGRLLCSRTTFLAAKANVANHTISLQSPPRE
mmetsp:Transcript_10277/g.28332  ORF Transcript_10277/g.28332 Transcript_10277/m.28332 type:complete len:208 (+) Transcript_10277:2609-3232(+)